MAVKVGTTFHAVYCDGNCKWTVIRKIGESVWLCRISDDEPDYRGVEQPFMTRQIENAVASDRAFAGIRSEHEQFYASLRPGQIIHYNNGFDNYVRCEAVMTTEGQMKLKPICLVGAWSSHDLPYRRPDGSIYLGYYAKKISEGELFEPNVTCIWEAHHNGADPTELTPIPLGVRPMTMRESVKALKWKSLDEIQNLCSAAHEDRDVDKALERIKLICTQVGK